MSKPAKWISYQLGCVGTVENCVVNQSGNTNYCSLEKGYQIPCSSRNTRLSLFRMEENCSHRDKHQGRFTKMVKKRSFWVKGCHNVWNLQALQYLLISRPSSMYGIQSTWQSFPVVRVMDGRPFTWSGSPLGTTATRWYRSLGCTLLSEVEIAVSLPFWMYLGWFLGSLAITVSYQGSSFCFTVDLDLAYFTWELLPVLNLSET